MRRFRCHQYGSSVERVHLPRSEGGRGVSSLEHVYEREVLSTTAYLCGSDEPHLKEVVQHQQYMSGRGRHSLLSNSVAIIDKYQLDITVGERGVERQGVVLSPKAASKLLSAAQNDQLKTTLEKKKIHGVFYSQCQMQGWDTKTSHGWLTNGRLFGRTEGLIVAAQDGVIHTRAYLVRVQKRLISPICRKCHKANETPHTIEMREVAVDPY